MDLLEYYHRTGKCPDRYYNQLNGKTADENYQAILARRQEYYRELLAQERLDKEIEKQVEEQIEKAVASALDDIFKNFGK